MNTAFLWGRLSAYGRLVRLDMLIGGTLLLWPTWLALWVAGDGKPHWYLAALFGIACFLMYFAGCAINDSFDRDVDARVLRTKTRPFPTGDVSVVEAWGLCFVCGVLGVLCLIPMQPLAWLTAIPSTMLLLTYPLTKRFFPVPQLYLGIAYSCGIPMAFAAQTDSLPPICWMLMLANIPWVIAFDTIYAISDKPDDVNIGIRTSALTFGRYDVLWVMILHGLHAILMAAVGMLIGARPVFWVFWAIALGLQMMQYIFIRKRDREACFRTFLFNNYVGITMFMAILAHYAAV